MVSMDLEHGLRWVHQGHRSALKRFRMPMKAVKAQLPPGRIDTGFATKGTGHNLETKTYTQYFQFGLMKPFNKIFELQNPRLIFMSGRSTTGDHIGLVFKNIFRVLLQTRVEESPLDTLSV